VVIGYGRVGGAGAQGLQSAGVPLSVVEEDLHLVQHLRTAGVPAIYGDAAYASVLQASHPERALLVVVTLPDAGSARTVVREVRQLNPGVPILVRAARADDEQSLRRAGANIVVAPEQAGADALVEHALATLAMPGGKETLTPERAGKA
jgi:monovalent cation:H+ antiporter-2, CPA2 family